MTEEKKRSPLIFLILLGGLAGLAVLESRRTAKAATTQPTSGYVNIAYVG